MRDPRNDPKRGDITISPNGDVFHVKAANRDGVKFLVQGEDLVCSMSLAEWRMCAADDQIERRAE